MFAPPNPSTDNPDRQTAQPYGRDSQHAMAALHCEARKIVGRVIDESHRKLSRLPKLARIVASLSADELIEFKTEQASELVALTSPTLTAGDHARHARASGMRNAMLGVSADELADSLDMLMLSLHDCLDSGAHAAAFATLGQRMLRELALQLQVYGELQAARSNLLKRITEIAWTADTYTDLIKSVTHIVGAHVEVVGCCVGRPDAQGIFRYESVSGPQTEDYIAGLDRKADQHIRVGDQPQGRGPTGRAWTHRRIECSVNVATDPDVATWRTSALAAGFRSSVAIPICKPGEEPRAVMTVYRGLPGGQSKEQVAFTEQLQSLLAFALGRIEQRNGPSRTIPYATRKQWGVLLRSGCLEMHYQPILDLSTGAITSVEALARLRDGDRLVTPNEFLPALTSEDLLILFVEGLQQATDNVCRWRQAGLSLKVTVNLPPSALADPRYFEHTRHTLKATSCRPEWVMFEILETDEVPTCVDVGHELRKYKELGIVLAQDDLGAGYSSLSRLRDLPFDCIKIDRSIVARGDNDEVDMLRFASQLTRLAHSMGKCVIVEGIEDLALLEAMAILGADRVQGFAIARPMAARQLDAWLENNMQPTLPDLARPSSRLGKLAQLLVWEESLLTLAIAMSETNKLAAMPVPHDTPSMSSAAASNASDPESPVDALLRQLSNSLPNVADDRTRANLSSAAIHHGLRSPEYSDALSDLLSRIADDAAASRS
ncbi:RNase II stability modulator [Burkholderia sp. 8Y]|uniref:EAL domain-containing protein n=1 Tax=Burkholderia sp. 8Y TaxID=2653133 RepID=UPI0012F198F3|nr:EAL domain-containing protein [Burkholderia sp. 8Y]VXC18705.1 RNase II stability modulator [Burkholderia sp. 8Y]